MKKSVSIALYVIVGAAVIWLGIWYNQKLDESMRQNESAAVQQQINTQSQIMDNLKVTDVVVGTGDEAKNGHMVTVNYVGTLDNGTKFDSSYDRNQPFSFLLGAGQVIRGWDLGVLGMKVGGKRQLVIPAELGYGVRGAGDIIPPNATLHFTVELLSVGK